MSGIIIHSLHGGGQSRQVSVKQTEQMFEPINVPVDDGNTRDYVSTTSTQCSTYQHMYQSMTMVIHVAMSIPQIQSSNLSRYQSKDGNIRGYVNTTDTIFKPINIPVERW